MPKGQNLAAEKPDALRCTFVRPDGSRCNSYRAKADADGEGHCFNHQGGLAEAQEDANALKSAEERMKERERENYRRDMAAIEKRQQEILQAPERTPEMVERRLVWVRVDLGPNHSPARGLGWLQDDKGFYFRWAVESQDVIEQRDRLMPPTVDVAAAERRDREIAERERQARREWAEMYPRYAAAKMWWGNPDEGVPPRPGHSGKPPHPDEMYRWDPRWVDQNPREPLTLADQTLYGTFSGPHLD